MFFSERLFHEIADRMVSDGYRDVGYDIVAMDDCWLERTRDSAGKLRADTARFPSGMKSLGDYVRSFHSTRTGVCHCYGV